MSRILLLLSALPLTLGFSSNAAAEQAIDAKRIFQESCSVCHGDDGRGAVWGQASLAVPPRNFRTVESRQELTRERMMASVIAGRPGTPMPGFGTQLSIEEVSAVVDWIRTEFMTPEGPAVADAGGARLPGNTQYGPIGASQPRQALEDDFSGDASRGALLYAENCVDCHGANGGGDGPRAYFIFPRPRNFQHPASKARFNRPELFSAIQKGVAGREMPAWEKVMSDQQIADITEYVFQTFINQP